MPQTAAQKRYGQRRTLANRLRNKGHNGAAWLIRSGQIEIPNIQENK